MHRFTVSVVLKRFLKFSTLKIFNFAFALNLQFLVLAVLLFVALASALPIKEPEPYVPYTYGWTDGDNDGLPPNAVGRSAPKALFQQFGFGN